MNNNTPTTNRRPITFLILAVLLAIGLALGLYLYSKGNLNSSKSASQPYKYTYSKLDSFTLLGQGPGDGISFQKPVQIATGDVQGHLHIRLNHSTMMQVLPSNKGSQPVLVAKLMVESDTTTTPPNADYLKFIKEDIKKPGSATAKGFKEQLSNFIAKDLTNYTVSLNSLQPITGGNLAGNA